MSFIEEMHCWQYSMTVFELFSEQNTRKLNYKMHLQFSKEIIEHGVKFLTTKMSEANVSFRNYKITLKETRDQNFTSVFMAYFC